MEQIPWLGGVTRRVPSNNACGKWFGRWREDVVLSNGTVKRLNRKRVLGTKEDFKTKREAQRAMDLILSPINSLDYRPTRQITFAEFARRWFEMVHPIAYKEGGSQATAGRHVRGKLIPAFGNIELKDITTEMLQSYVADFNVGWGRNASATSSRP